MYKKSLRCLSVALYLDVPVFWPVNTEAIKCCISSSDIYPYFQNFVCHISNFGHLHLNINLVYIIYNLKFPQCKSVPYLVKLCPLQCHCSDNKSHSVLHSLIDFLWLIHAFGKLSCPYFQNVSLIWSFLPQFHPGLSSSFLRVKSTFVPASNSLLSWSNPNDCFFFNLVLIVFLLCYSLMYHFQHLL